MRAADGKSSGMAVSGVLAALLVVLLYLKSIIPVLDFSIYFIVSLFPAIVLVETNSRFAWIFFFSTSVLSLLLPVNKLALLYYYSFFGYYGILKNIIESKTRLIIGFLIKIPLFLAALSLNYFLAFSFLPADAGELFDFPVLMVVATPVFIAYDYLYTLFMNFYENRIRKIIGRK